MKYKIFQMPLNEDSRYYVYERKDNLEKRGMYPPPRQMYKLVYEDTCSRIDPIAILCLHNQEFRPARKNIRSMSTGDILVYEHNGEILALFRDYVYFYPVIFTDDKITDVETEYSVKNGYAHVRLKYEDQDIDVDVSQMLNGGRYFKNTSGDKVKLSITQLYAVLQATVIEQERLKYACKRKTLDEWNDSGAFDFDSYVGVGDEVDEAIVDNFLGILTPACHTSHLMQMGEPNEHLPDGNGTYQPIYMTFERCDGRWYYRGYCFHGQTENHKQFPSYADMLAKLIN